MRILVIVQDELRSKRLPAPEVFAVILFDFQVHYFVVVVVAARCRECLVADSAGFVVAMLHYVMHGERLLAVVRFRAEFAVQATVAAFIVEWLETSLISVRLLGARGSGTSRPMTPQFRLGGETETADVASDRSLDVVVPIEMNIQGIPFGVEQPWTGIVRAWEVFVRDGQVDPQDVADDVRFVLRLKAAFITEKQIS